MADASDSISRELARIRWRQVRLRDPVSFDWLCKQAKSGARERDLGPHRSDCPTSERGGE